VGDLDDDCAPLKLVESGGTIRVWVLGLTRLNSGARGQQQEAAVDGHRHEILPEISSDRSHKREDGGERLLEGLERRR
jgi:hypothetical protein